GEPVALSSLVRRVLGGCARIDCAESGRFLTRRSQSLSRPCWRACTVLVPARTSSQFKSLKESGGDRSLAEMPALLSLPVRAALPASSANEIDGGQSLLCQQQRQSVRCLHFQPCRQSRD